MSRRAQACIDLDALQSNLQRVRDNAPDSKIMAVIKADAYGHGMLRSAQALAAADAFAVACVAEAVSLRRSWRDKPIVVLEGFTNAGELQQVIEYGLDPVIHHHTQLHLAEQLQAVEPINAWFKIDTGMHRLGFPPATVEELVRRAESCDAITKPLRWMTHLACADDRRSPSTEIQQQAFCHALQDVPGERSIANSAGILGWDSLRGDWVRPGIMLYGASPFLGGVAEQDGLRPVMTLTTQLIAVNQHKQGDAVGYGGSWVCPEDMPVGVAAIGYGDGYPRHAASGTPVLVNGKEVPLIGRVSMDMIMLDLRDQPQAQVGDEVQCWGRDLPVERVAQHADTIAYALLCGVSQRVERIEKGGHG